MRVLIQHRSRYVYSAPTLLGPQVIRLRPMDHARAHIESYRLDIAPEHRLHWQRDPHGNHVARVTFKAGERVEQLAITVEIAVDVRPVNPFDFFVDARAKKLPFTYPDHLDVELAPFLAHGDPAYFLGKRGIELLREIPTSADTIDTLVKINSIVSSRVAYVIRDEAGVWTPEETLANGRGSCRDSAVLLVALMRARGVAARFVSGYLVQLTDEGMIPDEPRGVERDVVDLHAWAEAYVPGAGWIGFDGTSGLLCGEGHIPLAATASPLAAAPLDGTSENAASSVEFSTSIMRLGHESRPTAPFSDDVWRELGIAGDAADAALTSAGLDVWIGGEPTFTLRPDVAGSHETAEWQGGALGEDKWQRGRALASTLRDRLTPGGVVLHRMGKHYPGESRPRWALDVIGRQDGSELWPVRGLSDTGESAEAKRFGEALCGELGVSAELHAAFEDPWEVMRAEALLPPTIDPRTAKLDDSEERKQLATIFARGVGAVVGYALPLGKANDIDGGGWLTDRWTFRRGELFLVPGDSPLGLRLPLSSLGPGMAPPEWADAPDWSDPRVDGDDESQAKKTRAAAAARRIAQDGTSIGLRTAIAIEPRDGQLWVFVPPVPRFSDFCALIHAIDRARTATGLHVHLEGYPPPPSPERTRFAVTPDPGVLEVNLPPVSSSRDATALYQTVFDAALANGLTAERYMLDGRAAGSGGGNHITIGGSTVERSPWLNRPDLLASLVTFAQHHPSLSYAMTGLFVGPTSQAPRVDEARHDSLYELEIALPPLFGQPAPPPWQIDALLRHLLVDIAGSTHRAEISIDKLIDPLTPFGRQGLVEMRAFEMPPHPRMLAAQGILVRSLLAAFTHAPYQHPLVRWGEALHDRFLLPHFLWSDLQDAIAHIGRCGVPLPVEAYRAFVELRCPLVGSLAVNDARVEIRNAIEPWHVLGEEATATGTSRYVDSSLERIEVKTIGLDPERYSVAVNNVVVPLRTVAGRDVQVAGVKFRAWAPPHSLQPHLGIHHPLRIDIVDRWAKRGVIGGQYHVWHPEGRAFDDAPLTRVEAAARRAQRFTVHGPTPMPLRPYPAHPHADQPYTMDLRRLDAGVPMPRAEDWIEQ
ncbi:MAG TPA: transglutaminase family protein [Kofleriaceae bacterium]